ncbi:MAG: penicillin-binding protein activator [Alphaproteobacteria bacterium]|nr:penicillin-binding protein activator [Alphaproteobacteria bacterium]MBV9372842.1 penicillin-binding protein activator [Alphaproteobacteria bacterium]MBV9900463.1 penicillin-binding protein activator [Alphaproteobacteria bacterium]
MAEQSGLPQARRSVLGLAAGGLLAFALSACQLVPAPRPEPPPLPEEETPPPAPQPEPARPGLPADAARNRVAVLVPLSGANAAVGQSIANAANLALLDTGGERIRITVYDTAKDGAAAAAGQARTEGNGLFLGPLLAEDVRAVATVARPAGIPVVAFSNDESVAGDGVYLMGFTPGQSVERVVAYARGAGLSRFGALTPNGVYGRRAAQAMVAATRSARLGGMQSFDRDPAAIRAAAGRLAGQGPFDAVLVADSGRTAALAAPALRAASPEVRLLGTELWATEGSLGATPALRGAWYASVSDTMFAQLRTRYRARYGTNPYRLASLGYDAVLLTVRIAKDWRFGRPFPERALGDPDGFTGIDGAFRFDPGGVAERSLEVREVTAAGTAILSPAPRGF